MRKILLPTVVTLAPLAPTNEGVSGAGDPRVAWVKSQLRPARSP